MNRNSRYPATFREEPVGVRFRFADIEPVWEQQKVKLIIQKLLTEVPVIIDM